MRNLSFLLCAATGLLAAGAALAADPAPGTAAPRGPDARRQHRIDRIDSNHDGLISRAEYRAWIDSRFARLDVNGDGRVDAAEIENAPVTARRVRRHAGEFVRHFDRSGGGTVSLADFEAGAMARFDRIGGGAETIDAQRLLARHPGPRPPSATNNDD